MNKGKKNTIVCLVGRSGSGKTTIANQLEDEYGYKVIESYTTRPPRYVGERGHIYITKQEYEEFNKDDIMAYTLFDDNHYFVTKEQIDTHDVYVVDMDGVRYLKDKLSNTDINIVVIYIDTKRSDTIKRMTTRGDSLDAIHQRLENDDKKFKDIKYDYCVPNKDLLITVCVINSIIMSEMGVKTKDISSFKRKMYGKLIRVLRKCHIIG